MKKNTALLQKHMKMFCETIGARPTGSEQNKAAVDYAFGVLQKCGLQVHKQGFDCIDWVNSGAVLSVDGQDVPVTAAEYTLSCDVDAEFICIDAVDVLRKAELSDKIVVLHGELCKEPLMPKNFEFWNPEEHKQIIALLEGKNPKAIIAISPAETDFISIIQDGDFNIPCAAVCGNALEAFLKSSGKKAKLTISAKRIPTKAHNVIATYGTGHIKICFSAHIDTKPNTPGALDNASGLAVLLVLAASLQKEYPFQIEFALLNGEDYYSTPGEITYMSNLTPDYIMAFNVDGIALKDSATSISFYECPQELENRILECAKKAVNIEWIEPWPMGDHMIFATVGIPAIALTASNIFNILESVTHTANDSLENIDFEVLDNIVSFLMSCI